LPLKEKDMVMNSDKRIFPVAMAASPGSSAVSAPFSVLPEQWAEQTGALGHAMMQLFAVPAEGQRKAAEDLTSRLEGMASSLEQVYQDANNSVQSVNVAVVETARLTLEQTLQFCHELAVANGPADAIRIQLGFLQSQAQLFSQQVKAIQREVSRLLMSYGPN